MLVPDSSRCHINLQLFACIIVSVFVGLYCRFLKKFEDYASIIVLLGILAADKRQLWG